MLLEGRCTPYLKSVNGVLHEPIGMPFHSTEAQGSRSIYRLHIKLCSVIAQKPDNLRATNWTIYLLLTRHFLRSI